MAWLNATPKEKERTRRETYVESAPQLEMVELSEYQHYLLTLWHECGTVSQGAGGLLPLEWQTIVTWANQFYTEEWVELYEHPKASKRHKSVYTPIVLKQCTLLDSELLMIRNLSQEYASEYAMASDPARPCPRPTTEVEVTEDAVKANADALLEGFKMSWGKSDTSVEVVQNK